MNFKINKQHFTSKETHFLEKFKQIYRRIREKDLKKYLIPENKSRRNNLKKTKIMIKIMNKGNFFIQ